MRIRILLSFVITLMLSSCVSQKKYDDMYALWVYTDSQYQLLRAKNNIGDKRITSLLAEISRLRKDSAYIDSVCRLNLNEGDAERARLEAERKKLRAELATQASRLKLSASK